MYCPVYIGLCPTMPPQKRIGLNLNCLPKIWFDRNCPPKSWRRHALLKLIFCVMWFCVLLDCQQMVLLVICEG